MNTLNPTQLIIFGGIDLLQQDKTDYFILDMNSETGEVKKITKHEFELEGEDKKTINPWSYMNYNIDNNVMLTIDHSTNCIYSFNCVDNKWKKEVVFYNEE